MSELRDVVVEIGDDCNANLESWLLGRGRIPAVLPDHPSGCCRYLIKEVSCEDIRHIELAGGRVSKT